MAQGQGQKGGAGSQLDKEIYPLLFPEAQSLLKDLTLESSKKGAAWLYRIDLVRNKLHLMGAEVKQLVARIGGSKWKKMVSLLISVKGGNDQQRRLWTPVYIYLLIQIFMAWRANHPMLGLIKA